MLAIPILHGAGVLTFPLLLVLVFALGCFLAPYFSAQRLILPELVGDDERTVAQANAIVERTQRPARNAEQCNGQDLDRENVTTGSAAKMSIANQGSARKVICEPSDDTASAIRSATSARLRSTQEA